MAPQTSEQKALLAPYQELNTTGARAVCSFTIENVNFLVIPQLAQDVPGQDVDMTKGDSNTTTLVYTYNSGSWREFQRLPSPGGEDAEAFEIDGRHYLAIASLRKGDGTSDEYSYTVPSTIYEYRNGQFKIFQQIPSFAAKQWRFFSIEGRHFLALAQGAQLDNDNMPKSPQPSMIYTWNGSGFEEFQSIESQWGYNWTFFTLNGTSFLAYADHTLPSALYRWNGTKFIKHQEFEGLSGRAFCFFEAEGDAYLIFARLMATTEVLRWDGSQFKQHQYLSGASGRELKVFQEEGQTYIFQINFISGTRQAPTTALQSFIYKFVQRKLVLQMSFPTSGATDATVIQIGSKHYLAVSESLAHNARFSTPTHIYKLSLPRARKYQQPEKCIYQSPEMSALFHTYTTNPSGVGASLKMAMSALRSSDPLIVATSTDVTLFPGNGQRMSILGFRFSTRGFKEIAGVSHLGPAMATIIKIRELEPASPTWKTEAQRMLAATRLARSANSLDLWVNKIQAEAYRGHESGIASMLDYGCAITIRFLETILADESKATSNFLREAYLEGTDGSLGAVIPFNYIMIATFYLVGMDIAFRMISWFQQKDIDWSRAEVLVVGKQGRPTAGVTITSNSVAQMIFGASWGALPTDRLFIAPHTTDFKITDPDDIEGLEKTEQAMREVWCYTKAISELSPLMFPYHPSYEPNPQQRPVVTAATKCLSEMPHIQTMTDIFAMVTRLRLVMEDPKQLLSGCMADLAVRELQRTKNDPRIVDIPGLTGYEYPSGLLDDPAAASEWLDFSRVKENFRSQHLVLDNTRS